MSKIYHKGGWLEDILKFVHYYMDYIIPLLVVCCFPIWILPYLFFLAFERTVSVGRYLQTVSWCFTNPTHSKILYYAILKGNGRYLREDCHEVLIYQFYDYTARRFMSVGQLEQDARIAELECQSQIGLIYLKDSNKLETVNGLQSHQTILEHAENDLGFIIPCDYSTTQVSIHYDCLLLFNLKHKMDYYPSSNNYKINLTTILSYCSHHLDQGGYLVYGDYFQGGEIKTFTSLFQGFNFIVIEQEDITKNIEYGQKLMKRRNNIQKTLISSLIHKIGTVLGRKQPQEGRKFIVFILQKQKQPLKQQ